MTDTFPHKLQVLLVSLALGLPLAVCGGYDAQAEDQAVEAIRKKVNGLHGEVLAMRIREYVRIYQGLDRQSSRNMKGPSASPLVTELVRQGDFEGIAGLEKSLDGQAARRHVWFSVVLSKNPKTLHLLKRWATRHPSVILLMPYHPKGAELLLKCAQDPQAPPRDRALCLHTISTMANVSDKETLEKLRALTKDTTRVAEPCGEELTSVGELAKLCLKRLQTRQGSPPQ